MNTLFSGKIHRFCKFLRLKAYKNIIMTKKKINESDKISIIFLT